MCGIAGTLDLRPGLEPAEDLVAEMTDALAHRGPDDAGMLVDPPVTLGHRRLSIIDLSPAGHQPMASEDESLWITFNGEIYNYIELRRELEALGHRFGTATDTEVLLHAFAQWGARALQRLNGMFAFAIWDRRARTLFCARDRFGVKPFYYAVAAGRLRFASEIKALFVDPDVPRAPNDARVLDFLAHSLADHTAETMFAGVLQLPPGSYLELRADGSVPEPTVWYRHGAEGRDGRPAPEVVRDLLDSAVRLRLRSDVPVGVALSGGMDSSSVLALASEARREQGAEPPVSFSARTSDPRTDEYRYSKAILRTTGSTNRHVLPNGEDLLQELDSLIWQMDEPFHSPSVYGQRKVHELARSSGIIVLLDGQGGDEALSGYHHFHYPGLLFTLLRRGHVRTWLSETRSRARLHEQGLSRTTKDMIKLLLPARFRTRHVPDWIAAGTAVPPLPVPKSDLASRQSFGLSVMPLPGFNHHNDRNSMTFSLEARNPFLDYRLVEAARSFAVEELLHEGITKWALREAVRDVVPAEIVDRVDKQGFTTDEATWLRDHLGDEFASVFASASLAERGYYDPAKLVASLAAHRAGSSLASLWRAYIVERWLRLFIDPARLEAPPRPETALRPHVGAAANVARPKAHPETGPVEAVSRASEHPAG